MFAFMILAIISQQQNDGNATYYLVLSLHLLVLFVIVHTHEEIKYVSRKIDEIKKK